MQVVVHLRTVEPSDAHCDDRIADDGRGGKGVCGCGSVWGKRGFRGSNKVQSRLTALVQIRFKGSIAPDGAGSIGFKREKLKTGNAGDRERECVDSMGTGKERRMLGTGKESVWVWVCVGGERVQGFK
jgi:hypothetical protein